MKEKILEILNKVKEFLADFFEKPIALYAEFLKENFGVAITADKMAMYFWLSVGAITLSLILLILIINSIVKASKEKKQSKEVKKQDVVQDAIEQLEKKEEKAVVKAKEEKKEETINTPAKEKIIVEEIPPISAKTVDEAAPIVEPTPIAEEINNQKANDQIVKEVKKAPVKRTTTTKKVSEPKPESEKKETVKKETKPKATVTVTKKTTSTKVKEDEDNDDLSTTEFLAAALLRISEEYEQKLASEKNSKKKAKEYDYYEEEIKTEPAKEVKVEPVKEVKVEPVVEEKPVVEEVKVEPEVTITRTHTEEYDENKHSSHVVTQEELDEPTVEVDVEDIAEEEKVEKKVAVKKATTTKKQAPVKKQAPKKVVEKEEKIAPQNAKGKYTISQECDDFRYRLKASNGETLFTSEPYIEEMSARKGIATLKKQLAIATIDVVEEKHGLFSFRVITRQGRCLGTSANYSTKASALSAVESFKRFAETDKVELEENQEHYDVEEYKNDVEIDDNGKYKVIEKDGKFTYQLIASNGRIIATSNIYSSKDSCLEGFEKFRMVVYDGSFMIYKDKNSKYQFKLYNKQKRLILAGEVYDDKSRAVSVIESIKKFAKKAKYVAN